MGLHWNLTDIADMDNVCFEEADHDSRMGGYKKGDRIMRSVTNALIWATIPVGLGSITAENMALFSKRLRVYESAFGAFLQEKKEGGRWGDRFITDADVKAHVGLSTNASRLTDAKFRAQVMERLERESESALRYERQAAAATEEVAA